MREEFHLLVVTDTNTDELAMRMASSALYAAWGEAGMDYTLLATRVPLSALEAHVGAAYDALYHLDAAGELSLVSGLPPEGAKTDFAYTTVIARPDNLSAILRAEQRRHCAQAQDSLSIRAQKNEWIEAAFAASELAAAAPCPFVRKLVLLPGKNYQLDEDTELFSARLDDGCLVEASDLRCYYFLRGRIRWESANFTAKQLDDAAKLPAALTPAYVHGNGDITLSAKAANGPLRHREFALPQPLYRYGTYARVASPSGSAHAQLGHPQPGDALSLCTQPA